MKKTISLTLICALLQTAFCLVLLPNNVSARTLAAESIEKSNQSLAFQLQDGTPIKLRLGRNMSSADAKTGESVDFEVLEDIKVGETVVIPRGGTALGTVTNAKPKGRMGKGGKLDLTIDHVRLVSGEKVALRAVKEGKGKGSTGAMTGAIVATSILFFPAAPIFLFMKGKDITIPKGTEITAYVNGDIQLDPAKFTVAQPGQAMQTIGAAQSSNSTATESTNISVKSAPEGAEIMINDKFAGSTPSTLQLKLGEYKISVKKAGYATWERTITLSSGSNITIDAALVKAPR